MESSGRSAFFYGTLMAPQVLHRVCHGSTDPSNPIFAQSSLTTRPAVLHDHRRHRVRGADYPAIVPHGGSAVRGTVVTGLTDADVWRLDIFEGDQYVRANVRARVLTAVGDGEGRGNVEGDEVDVETYVWCSSPDELEDREWDFAEFQREKMRFWVGAEGAGEYAEVDEAVAAANAEEDGTGGRGLNGHITKALEEERKKDERTQADSNAG